MATRSHHPVPPLNRGLTLLLSGAAFVISMAGLRSVSSSLGPLVIALVLTITVSPLQSILVRKGLNRTMAMIASMLVSGGIIIGMIVALFLSGRKLAQLVSSDEYQQSLTDTADTVGEWLRSAGVREGAVLDAVNDLDVSAVAGQVSSFASSVAGVLSLLLLVFMGIFFMSSDSGKFGERLEDLAHSRPNLYHSLHESATSIRSYMLIATLFGGIVAVLDAAALWMLGIPLALVWGVVSFITNYIPNVGFVLGVIPPALLALLQGGFTLMVIVVAVYVGLNFVIQSLIQPRVVGDRVGLSTTLTFVSLLFWSYMLGAIGALMAVPLTLLMRAFLIDSDPSMHWLRPLISLNAPVPTEGDNPEA